MNEPGRSLADVVAGPEPPPYAKDMTLRDHFAGLAMAAFLAAPATQHTEYGAMAQSEGDMARGNPDACACWAYVQADSMLAARDAK